MPTYEHMCKNCEHEWEDIYSMNDPVPSCCPNCQKEGGVKRLISAPGSVKVELTGYELRQQLKKETKELSHKARTDENTLANLVGEEKYNENLNKRKK